MSEETKETTQSTDDSDLPEPMEGEINRAEDYDDEDQGEGFDPLQRRFLWTITAVLVLAMFGSAWWINYSQQKSRTQMIRISGLADEHNLARQQLAQAQNILGDQIVRAYLQNDTEKVNEYLEQLTNVYRNERLAFANLRKEQELPVTPVTEEMLTQYGHDAFGQLKQRAEAIRQQAAASTQPASRPANSGAPAANP